MGNNIANHSFFLRSGSLATILKIITSVYCNVFCQLLCVQKILFRRT
jgi:hypothetical protein